jgi:hypothetical protein
MKNTILIFPLLAFELEKGKGRRIITFKTLNKPTH